MSACAIFVRQRNALNQPHKPRRTEKTIRTCEITMRFPACRKKRRKLRRQLRRNRRTTSLPQEHQGSRQLVLLRVFCLTNWKDRAAKPGRLRIRRRKKNCLSRWHPLRRPPQTPTRRNPAGVRRSNKERIRPKRRVLTPPNPAWRGGARKKERRGKKARSR